MSEVKIVIPEGMLKAAQHAFLQNKGVGLDGVEECLEAALRWLSENPIVPTKEQAHELVYSMGLQEDERGVRISDRQAGFLMKMWQRRMFDVPETEPGVPEAIKSGPWERAPEIVKYMSELCMGSMRSSNASMDWLSSEDLLQKVILAHWLTEAYRRGQKTGSQ